MKTVVKTLILMPILTATFAAAGSNANLYPYVQHVIVVIQENRTPDDLFYEDSTLYNNGNGGHVRPPNGQGLDKCSGAGQPLQSTPFYTCWDPDHTHGQRGSLVGAWTTTWDNGNMDGACGITLWWSGSDYCGSTPPPCLNNGANNSDTCPYA